MYKILLIFLLLTVLSGNLFSADTTVLKPGSPDLKILKEHIIQHIFSAEVNVGLYMGFADNINEDGSWQDINYADTTRGNWQVADHLGRIINMAVIYKRPGSKWRNDPGLGRKILAGLDYWFKNDFICPNWWYPQIGVPMLLAPTMLLMEENLTAPAKQAGIKILDRAKIGMTGQNKVWLSGNVINRGLLTGDADQIKAAVNAIQEELIISEGEGIQPDYSFHQHGTQQQFGTYGSAYANDMLKWAMLFQNTPFRFEEKKIAILRSYLLEGMRWVVWKNKMDISACGRQLFPNAQAGKANDIKAIFNKMPLVDSTFTGSYLVGMEHFDGHKHFWKSDMSVHRRKHFYASVKMSSNRVGGAESCNEENIQGYHLGDGATYFYQSGDEYTDIFPLWDWKRIPGTTTFYDTMPLPLLSCNGYNIKSDFVGGVSDGMNGVATLAYNRDSLSAQKSWFFFDDAIICLGTGIRTHENKEVTTTINQSFLHGDVFVKQTSTPRTVTAGQHILHDVSWVLHDNWGYYFPGQTNIEVANRRQSGAWNKVVKRMPSKQMEAAIFTLGFNHHRKPRAANYSYYVFPAATAENIDKRASAIHIIENSAQVQSVENPEKGMAGFVFVQAGAANAKLINKVTANQPCILFITKKNNAFVVYFSDPTHLLTEIVIGLAGKKISKTADAKYDRRKHITWFTLTFPRGPDAGRTASFTVQ